MLCRFASLSVPGAESQQETELLLHRLVGSDTCPRVEKHLHLHLHLRPAYPP